MAETGRLLLLLLLLLLGTKLFPGVRWELLLLLLLLLLMIIIRKNQDEELPLTIYYDTITHGGSRVRTIETE